jgi:hypothetical protein
MSYFFPTGTQLATTILLVVLTIIVSNVLGQILFKDSRKPPVVFHLVPGIGSTVSYGQDPYAFFFGCREKVCLCLFVQGCGVGGIVLGLMLSGFVAYWSDLIDSIWVTGLSSPDNRLIPLICSDQPVTNICIFSSSTATSSRSFFWA